MITSLRLPMEIFGLSKLKVVCRLVTPKTLTVRSKKKFNAYKEYAKKYNLHWGFVRDIDEELYINNTIYTEDMSGDNWISLDDVLK